jgi:hypothetical protein
MRGGKRPGAGRKKASAARELEATGLTPCDVMPAAMRQLWALAQNNKNNRKLNEHYVRAAVAVAKDLAPYIHPRISSTVPASDAPPTKHFVMEIIGGLPIGSTPERPEGTEYSEVPPGEPPLRHILIGEELEMVLVADVLACGVMRSRPRRELRSPLFMRIPAHRPPDGAASAASFPDAPPLRTTA